MTSYTYRSWTATRHELVLCSGIYVTWNGTRNLS